MKSFATSNRRMVRALRRGFTLIEIMVALTIGLVFLAVLVSFIAISMRMVYKNVSLQDATTSTRMVQEYLSREISQAVSVPDFYTESVAGSNKFAEIRYRVLVGPTGKVVADTLRSSNTIVLACPGDLAPKAGDFLMITTPNVGADGARIIQVDDPRTPGLAGNVTVTLSDTINALTLAAAVHSDLEKDTNLAFQRERCFRVNPPDAGSPVCTMEWLETTRSYTPASGGTPATAFDPPGLVICTKVDANNRYLFSREPAVKTATEEPGLIWEMNYLSGESNSLVGNVVGGMKGAYMASHTEGMIMPKSNNPLGTGGIIVTKKSTSTTSTTSTTTTSISTTTTSTTSTTTTKTTSTSTTKTTSTSTTKTTTTKTTSTSTTSKSTTSIPTTSTTKTTTTSTTSKSTTSIPTTSTTKTTTTKTTSTTTSKTTSTSTTSTVSTTTSTTTSTTKPTTSIVDG